MSKLIIQLDDYLGSIRLQKSKNIIFIAVITEFSVVIDGAENKFGKGLSIFFEDSVRKPTFAGLSNV